MNPLLQAAYWGGLWLGLIAAICLVGAFLGGLTFPLIGSLLEMDLSAGEMLRNGLMDGGFLALIWAPGLSFVACLMWARSKRQKPSITMPNPLDTED